MVEYKLDITFSLFYVLNIQDDNGTSENFIVDFFLSLKYNDTFKISIILLKFFRKNDM